MNITNFIFKQIRSVCIDEKSRKVWYDRQKTLYRLILTLRPDRPNDKSINFIAFNVPDKDRMKIKTGRFLSRKLSLNSGFLSDKGLQKIADAINLELFGVQKDKIKLLTGADITSAYRQAIGSISCMTGPDCGKTRLYESNPKRFSMLIMTFGNDTARGIVHKLDNGKYLLDRVYGSSETIKSEMQNYAKRTNWLYRGSTELAGTRIYQGETEIFDYSDIMVSDLEYEDGEIPFMDTLKNGCIGSNLLTISYSESDYSLDNTCGILESGYCCEGCGENVHEDDAYSSGGYTYCRFCFDEHFFYCEGCGKDCNNDDSVHIEDTGEYVCTYCAETSRHYCGDCNSWYKDATYLEGVEVAVCNSCLKNYLVCDDCNEYHHIDNHVFIENGGHDLCDNCAAEYPTCESCGDQCRKSELIEIEDGDNICEYCE